MQTGIHAGELEAQAIAWLVRSEAVDCGADELVRLEAWLACPRHRVAFVRMRAAWTQADQLRRLQPLDGNIDPDLLNSTLLPSLRGKGLATSSGRRSLGYLFAAAAMTALVIGVTAWLLAQGAK